MLTLNSPLPPSLNSSQAAEEKKAAKAAAAKAKAEEKAAADKAKAEEKARKAAEEKKGPSATHRPPLCFPLHLLLITDFAAFLWLCFLLPSLPYSRCREG